jgi:hypothetical protein
MGVISSNFKIINKGVDSLHRQKYPCGDKRKKQDEEMPAERICVNPSFFLTFKN